MGPTHNSVLEVWLDHRVLHINNSGMDVRCIYSGLLVAVHINSGLLDEINIDSGLLDMRQIDSDLLGIVHTNSCLLGIGHFSDFSNGLLDVGIIVVWIMFVNENISTPLFNCRRNNTCITFSWHCS